MKKLKIYLLVLLLFVVQFYYIALPVECSEVNNTENTVSYTWEYLTNSEGVTVGKLYDGGYEKTSTTIKYPVFYVYITTDGEVLDLTNYNYVMRKYTTTKTGLEKGEYLSDTKPKSNNNYFEIDVANDPNLNYWELVIKNEDKTETIIELEEPILGTKAPGEEKAIEIYLETKAKTTTEEEEEKGLIIQILDALKYLKDGFNNIINSIVEGITNAFSKIFSIPEDTGEKIDNTIDRISETIPILGYPLKVIKEIVINNEAYWQDNYNIGLEWEKIELFGYELVPAGSWDAEQLMREHDAFQQIHNIYMIIYRGVLVIMFFNYFKRKVDQIIH